MGRQPPAQSFVRIHPRTLLAAALLLGIGAAYALIQGLQALSGGLAVLSLAAVVMGVLLPQLKGRQRFGLHGVEVNVAEAPTAPEVGPEATVQLAQSGETPSFDPALYSLLRNPDPVRFAIVDLGNGHEWLSSRLFVIAALLERSRGATSIVFLERRDRVSRRYVGIADIRAVRWGLAKREPWLDAALIAAQTRLLQPNWPTWFDFGGLEVQGLMQLDPGFVKPDSRPSHIASVTGALDPPEALADLLFTTLHLLRIVPTPDGKLPSGWVSLPMYGDPNPNAPRYWECARWLSASDLKELLDDALLAYAVQESPAGTVNADEVIRWPMDVVPIINRDGVFVKGADRVATLMTTAASEPTPRSHRPPRVRGSRQTRA